ncbi:hypothetical protein BMI90_06945 [Thioclava sp. L04-15]|jgi:Sulfate permease and related transporters (MFS superfamily)|uniref:SulP family inorganic anion transporter n=1 Tax=Thioclava sp. L04-15 TaxID=1915318 RepID=UPI00099606DE|nr:SulP family inorganic anion transporter [Thioclava sp. L04-15]OOY28408.1 hypothetical protein BMI90_06945 [Thioclava sp. L04-15]TNE94549.1 MAG: SulP family inorganic anion transporter [Paracoccaceae bacterium]
MRPSLPLFPSLPSFAPRADLFAALTLAAIAIPEQLATAQLAGLPAAQGLIVFAVASVVMVLVGRNPTLSVGADSTIAPLIATALAAMGAMPGDPALLAAMVGAMLLVVWLLRLEWMAELLSKPVTSGMLAGIAVHIFVGRLPVALGLSLPPGSPIETVPALWDASGQARLAPFVMAALITLACVIGAAVNRRLPIPLSALVCAIAVAAFADPSGEIFPRIRGVAGDAGLHWPALSAARAIDLLPTALSITFLCLSQTTVVLRTSGADSAPERRNAFGALALANLATAAGGGFGVNSSPPRTQILRESGAGSQLAGLGAALIGLALLGLGAGVLSNLPAAALAGVLSYIALHLLSSARLHDLIRRSSSEGAIALATAGLVILLPLQYGLPLAILLSLVYASMPLFQSQVVELHNVPGTTVWWRRPASDEEPERYEGVLVLGITSPISFANASGIMNGIRRHVAAMPGAHLVVLECAGVLAVDLTGADRLGALIEELRGRGLVVALARLEAPHAQDDLARSGLLSTLGEKFVFQSVDAAIGILGGPADKPVT